MKKLLLLFSIFIGVGLASELEASHLAGGDIQYRYIGDSTGIANHYEILVRLYRDASGIGMGTSINVSVCSSCYATTSVNLPLVGGGVGSVAPTLFDCVDPGPTTKTLEIYIYKNVVVLPGLCNDWKFTYSTCCRNGGINNIVNPASQAFYIEAVLNNYLGNNTSPFFVSEPVRAFCVNKTFNWKQSAVEPDGDSIRYSLSNVKGNSGNCSFNNLTYSGGYTMPQPITTTPPNSLYMNPGTGVITFTPAQVEIDVLAVVVEEFRFDSTLFAWVKIAESNRDMQISVSPACSPSAQQGVFLDPNATGVIVDPATGLQTKEYTCLDSSVVLDFGVKLDCSSISPDGTDFRLTAPDGQPIPIESFDVNCDANGETQQITLNLYKPLSFNGYYYLYSKIGNDGNTLVNKCGFPMAEFDTIQLHVQGCFTTNIDMRNVTIVDDEYPKVSWLLDTVGTPTSPFPPYLVDEYKVYRQDPGQPNYALVYVIQDYKSMYFNDKSLGSPDVDANSYKYRVEVVVNGKVEGPTRDIHSILLESDVDPNQKSDTIDFSWNSYNGWPGPLYTVELGTYDPANSSWTWVDHANPNNVPVNPTLDTFYTMINVSLQEGTYAARVRADYPGGPGLDTAYSNWIWWSVTDPPPPPPPPVTPATPIEEIPNVFTPNGDGVNEGFIIPNIMTWESTRSVTIFNRWGNVVYQTDTYDNDNPFVGKDMNGNQLADGVYYYIIEVYHQSSNQTETHNGSVTIMSQF